MPKLIFIEGVSGVGKSTTTQKLCDKLRGMGFSVDRTESLTFLIPLTSTVRHTSNGMNMKRYSRSMASLPKI